MLTRNDFRRELGSPAVIGMVHLQPLPGAPLWSGAMEAVIERAVGDAERLEQAGLSGVMVENFGDLPFAKTAGPATVAAMAVVISRIRQHVSLPVGVNVLRNDARAALSIAAATGASFIRVNVLSGVMVTDQGVVEGDAASVLRWRRELGLERVAIFADLLVKHARPLVETDLADAAHDLRGRALADAVLVTGEATGRQVDFARLRSVRQALPDAPIVVASGVSAENAAELAEIADGFIVGTSIKTNGVSDASVDLDRARQLMAALK